MILHELVNFGRVLTGAGADATNAQESRGYDGCKGNDDNNGTNNH
jgi:hypothetical protein